MEIPRFFWFCSIEFDRNTLHCVIQCVKEFKIHSVEKVSEVSHESNEKTWSKDKANLNTEGLINSRWEADGGY